MGDGLVTTLLLKTLETPRRMGALVKGRKGARLWRVAAVMVAAMAIASATAHAQAATQGAPAGAAPKVTLEPDSISFMAMPAGSISPSQLLKVTNTGNAPLNVTGLQLVGLNLPEFAFASSCVLPVAPGGNCIINVTFSPLVEGQHTAKVLISDDAANSPQPVALSGTASNPFVLSTTGSTTASIAVGQAAQYDLQISSSPGFMGVVQLQCIGVPLGAECSATPPTVAQAGGNAKNAPIPFVVKVTTTPEGNPSALTTLSPGTYMLTVSASWGLISKKTNLTLTVK